MKFKSDESFRAVQTVTERLQQDKLRADTAKIIQENKANSPEAIKATKVSETLDNLSLVNSVLADENLSKAVGIKSPGAWFGGWIGSMYGSDTIPTVNKLKQISAILSLDSRQKLKGSGAISDFEAKTLAEAASAFSTGLSNEDAKKELKKIRGAFTTASGLPATVKITNSATSESKVIEATREGINQAIRDKLTVEYQ